MVVPCLYILLDKWSPALQIRTVLLSIQALLSAPNPDDPLANDVAEAWKTNEGQAIETGLFAFSYRLHNFKVLRPTIFENVNCQSARGGWS